MIQKGTKTRRGPLISHEILKIAEDFKWMFPSVSRRATEDSFSITSFGSFSAAVCPGRGAGACSFSRLVLCPGCFGALPVGVGSFQRLGRGGCLLGGARCSASSRFLPRACGFRGGWCFALAAFPCPIPFLRVPSALARFRVWVAGGACFAARVARASFRFLRRARARRRGQAPAHPRNPACDVRLGWGLLGF